MQLCFLLKLKQVLHLCGLPRVVGMPILKVFFEVPGYHIRAAMPFSSSPTALAWIGVWQRFV